MIQAWVLFFFFKKKLKHVESAKSDKFSEFFIPHPSQEKMSKISNFLKNAIKNMSKVESNFCKQKTIKA